MAEQPQYLTAEGLQNLERKLKTLKEVRRPEVAERLRQAMEEGGDLTENAEYMDAKNEQAFVEGEIARLERILSSAEVIEANGSKDVVGIGSRVTVIDQETKEQIREAMPLVPDDLVQRITASGTPDEVKARVRQYVETGCTCPILYPLGDPYLMIEVFSGGYSK